MTIKQLHIGYIPKSKHYYLVNYIQPKIIENHVSCVYQFSIMYLSCIPDVSEKYRTIVF